MNQPNGNTSSIERFCFDDTSVHIYILILLCHCFWHTLMLYLYQDILYAIFRRSLWQNKIKIYSLNVLGK